MKYKIALVLFTAIIFFGCETNPPNALVPNVEFGELVVTTNVDSAEIFVNNIASGYYTPDTLKLKSGTHNILLVKEGYFSSSEDIDIEVNSIKNIMITLEKQVTPKVVLLENFSNVSCGPCVESNRIIKSLYRSYGVSKLVVIKYAASFPSPNDPMYLSNPADSKSRIDFYNILFTPTIIVNGVDKPIASDSNSIKTKINDNLLNSPKFKITAAKNIVGETLKISGTIKLLDATELNFNNLILHTVVIESMIEYQTPPGSNGETQFENVMRKMLPNNKGFGIKDIEDQNEISFSFETEINAIWNKSKLEVVLFVQNTTSRKVYQAVFAN